MTQPGRPFVMTLIAALLTTVAVWMTVSTVTNVSAGTDLSAKGVGFLILLWLLGIGTLALAILGWVRRAGSPSGSTDEAAVIIDQEADETGAPSAETIRRVITDTMIFSRWSSAVDFLVKLGAERGARPGEFRYRDATRGSGSARLENFTPDEITRIDDYFRVEEMRVTLGLPARARQPLPARTFWSRPASLLNPIPMVVFGCAMAVLAIAFGLASSIGPMKVPGDTVTWVYLPAFAALGVGAVVVIVQQARRVPVWLKLRRAFQLAGEPLPTGLRGRD